MPENVIKEPEYKHVDRRNNDMLKTLAVGVICPLAVTMIIGYVSSYNTISKLVVVAEHSEKRVTDLEKESKQHSKDYHDMLIILTKHNQIIDALYSEALSIKEERSYKNRRQ